MEIVCEKQVRDAKVIGHLRETFAEILNENSRILFWGISIRNNIYSLYKFLEESLDRIIFIIIGVTGEINELTLGQIPNGEIHDKII